MTQAASEQDLGGDARLAAAADELDARVQVRLAGGQPLGEVEREARLDEDVQAPAFDLGSLARVLYLNVCFCRLRNGAADVRGGWDVPSRRLVSACNDG